MEEMTNKHNGKHIAKYWFDSKNGEPPYKSIRIVLDFRLQTLSWKHSFSGSLVCNLFLVIFLFYWCSVPLLFYIWWVCMLICLLYTVFNSYTTDLAIHFLHLYLNWFSKSLERGIRTDRLFWCFFRCFSYILIYSLKFFKCALTCFSFLFSFLS